MATSPRILITPEGHEVIYGRTGTGKTRMVQKRIAEDTASDRASWIVDLHSGALRSVSASDDEPVTTIEDARQLLDAARGVRVRGWFGVPRRDPNLGGPITITIDDAHHVLADRDCRQRVEDLLRKARYYRVRLRLVVDSLEIRSFGGSELIRSSLV